MSSSYYDSVDDEVFSKSSTTQLYPLGTVMTRVDEENNEEIEYIYLEAHVAIAANTISYLDVNQTARLLPAAGGEKNIVPLGIDYAVGAGEYAFFVIRGTFTGTADAAGITNSNYVEWIKATTTLKDVVGLKTATTIGYAKEAIAANATGKIYLFGTNACDVAV